MKPALDDGDVRIYHDDALAALAAMPAASVHCIVTSPPFWGLRDYGTGTWQGGDPDCEHIKDARGGHLHESSASTRGGAQSAREGQKTPYAGDCGKCGAIRVDSQIGLEETPDEWVAKLVAVFREARRVLHPTGTFWLEVGDVYATGAGAVAGAAGGGAQGAAWAGPATQPNRMPLPGLKPKDLIGAPWMLAFALRADGWWLRAENIWHKPNPMPESTQDRTTRAHSQVFLLTRSRHYYYDPEPIREALDAASVARYERGSRYDDPLEIAAVPYAATRPRGTNRRTVREGVDTNGGGQGRGETTWDLTVGANARSVWTIASEPTSFAHFATMPTELAAKCIKAGTSEHGACSECGAPWRRVIERGESDYERLKGDRTASDIRDEQAHRGAGSANTLTENGTTPSLRPRTQLAAGWRPTCDHDAPRVPCTVLDPFMGSGTTALVARRLGRHAVGVELSRDYLRIARDRLQQLALPL